MRVGPARSALLPAVVAVLGIGAGSWPKAPAAVQTASASEPISGCKATDGDTVRCGDERIRLLGIDAPELPGHCRTGRRCAPGDPKASRSSLAAGLTGELRIERVGKDRYGRTLAMLSGASGDLSCRQLAAGEAIYRRDWDDGGRVRSACPDSI